MCYHIWMFNNQEPAQAIGEHVVKVPRLLMAHTTTDELFRLMLLLSWQGHRLHNKLVDICRQQLCILWLKPSHLNPILKISLHTMRAFYISPTTSWGKGLRVFTGAVQFIYRSTPTSVILHCRKLNCRHRIANRQSTTPHKLWLAVRRWYSKFLCTRSEEMEQQEATTSCMNSYQEDFPQEEDDYNSMLLTSTTSDDSTSRSSLHNFSCLSRTQTSSRWVTTSNLSTREFCIPRTTPLRCN